MANVTPDHLRGFLVPFQDFSFPNYWAQESAITQGASYSGVLAPQQSSSLVLQSSGSQSKGMEIETFGAGYVGVDNASFRWRYEGDPDYYGKEVPNKLCGIMQISSAPPLLTTFTPRNALKTAAGSILSTVEETSPLFNIIRLYRTTLDGTLSNVAIDSKSISGLLSQSRFPTLCLMPDSSILCYAWEIDATLGRATIRSWRSIDDGVTWTVQSANAMPSGDSIDLTGAPGAGASGFDLGKITAASNSNSVLMFCEVIAHNTDNKRNKYIQYASYSAGTILIKIDESVNIPSDYFKDPDLIEFNGIFVLSFGYSTAKYSIVPISNSSTPLSSLSGTDLDFTGAYIAASNKMTGGGKTMFVDSSGRIHVYALQNAYNFVSYAYSDLAGLSPDNYGRRWRFFRSTPLLSVTSLTLSIVLENKTQNGVNTTIRHICGVSSQGSQLLYCNGTVNGGNPYANAVQIYEFGGWRTIQYPQLTSANPEETDSGYNKYEWIPVGLPTDSAAWTASIVGVTTSNLMGKTLDLTATSASSINYSIPPDDKTNGLLIHSGIKDIIGGVGASGTGFSLKIQEQTSTQTYWAEIIVQSGSINVYDKYNGTPTVAVASDLNTSAMLGDYIFLIYLNNATGNLRILYANSASPVAWKELSTSLTLNANTTQHVKWGILLNTGAAQESKWSFFSVGMGAGNGTGLSGLDPEFGAQYPAQGYWADIKDGFLVSTLDGPARRGETWLAQPQYKNGVDKVFYDVSPATAIGWQSNTVATPDTVNVPQEKIAWILDTDIGDFENSIMTTTALGLHLEGINFRQFDIETYNASTSTWSIITSVDNSVGGGFSFVRSGHTVFSLSATGSFFHFGEAKNWKIQLSSGENTVVRNIKYNGEGVRNAAGSKVARFLIDGTLPTDPTSGTAHIIPSSCTVIFQSNLFAALRITINSQRTNEGYFKIGSLIWGECVIPGNQYSRGRSITWDADNEVTEQSNGVLRTNKRGKGGRNVRIAWSEGVETSQIWNVPASPDFWKLQATGTESATVGSAPTTMMGLCQIVEGSRVPIVYLPSLKAEAGAALVFNRYHEHMMCTMGQSVEIQNVIGDELQGTNSTLWGEVLRVATVSLREVR